MQFKYCIHISEYYTHLCVCMLTTAFILSRSCVQVVRAMDLGIDTGAAIVVLHGLSKFCLLAVDLTDTAHVHTSA